MYLMLRCSRYLWVLSALMIAFPVVYLVFATLIFELKSKGVVSIALSPLFYLSCIFWIVTGIGIRKMKQWSWYTFGAAQFFSTYLNALNLANYSESEFKGYAFAFTIIVQFYLYFVVEGEIRVPFLFPNLKWWESGIAGMHHIPVEVQHTRSATGSSTVQLLDMNMKGCFLKSPLDFQPFEKVTIRMNAYGQSVDIPGVIVWNAKSAVTHPKGIGVQFVDLNRNRKRKVKVISKRFTKEKDSDNVSTPVSA